MALVYRKIHISDVLPLLKSAGYGFHSSRNYALQLNVPSKTRMRKCDGFPYRDPLRGMTSGELDEVLRRAETPQAAAAAIEKFSTGAATSAVEEVSPETMTPGLTAEAVAGLIDSRVRTAVARELEASRTAMASLLQELEAKVAKLGDVMEAKPPTKRKAPRAAGGKRTEEEVDDLIKKMNLPTGPLPAVDVDVPTEA